MKTTIAAALLLLAAAPASASCFNGAAPPEPEPPAVLKPLPGEVYGCPVYARVHNGKFWFSVFAQPFNNILYGFSIDAQPNASDWSAAISGITTQNWALTQWSNAFQADLALAGITFTPTTKQFSSPDGPVIIITGDIRQGF